MKILMHLISGQNSQVYFAIKQFNPDQNVFFYTKESKKNLPQIYSVIDKESSFEVEIKAFDYQNIKDRIVETVDKYQSDDNVLIMNITGGTKIQSIALFQVATDRNLSVVYVNSEDHHILEIAGNDSVIHPTNKPEINPVEYLMINGQKLIVQEVADSPNSDRLVDVLSRNFWEFSTFTQKLARFDPLKKTEKFSAEINSGKLAGSKYEYHPGLFKVKLVLKGKVLFEAEEKPGSELVKDFTGGWLEKASFKYIAESGKFTGTSMNLKIAYSTDADKNEFDILAMKGTDLCLFECKSGNVKAADIDQLVALRGILGKYTRLFLIACFKPRDILIERLSEYNIKFILFSNIKGELKKLPDNNPNI